LLRPEEEVDPQYLTSPGPSPYEKTLSLRARGYIWKTVASAWQRLPGAYQVAWEVLLGGT
jgi:hypothetical protein